MKDVIRDLVAMSQKKEGIRSHLEGRQLTSIEMEIEILDRSVLSLEEIQAAHERVLKNLHRAMKTQQMNIDKLELICVIHGIDDLQYWMNKEYGYLVNEMISLDKQGITQVPLRLRPQFCPSSL